MLGEFSYKSNDFRAGIVMNHSIMNIMMRMITEYGTSCLLA